MIRIPIKLGGKVEAIIQAEEIDADIPLLIGNSTLKKARAELKICEPTLKMGEEILQLIEMKSGPCAVYNLSQYVLDIAFLQYRQVAPPHHQTVEALLVHGLSGISCSSQYD